MTGVAVLNVDLIAKRLELLHELVPKADTVAVLVNPNSAYTGPESCHVHEAGLAAGLKVLLFTASNENEIDTAFANMVRQKVGALIVSADPFFTSHRDQIVALTARHAIPAIYQWRDFTEIGGLVSYGADRADIYRQTGIYVGRILSGVQPSDLPIMQPTKFELVINLKTAKTLAISVPIPILAGPMR
jgi:putative ABC transport system substrate-binding protein